MTRLTADERAVTDWARALVQHERPGGPNLIGGLLGIIDRLTAPGRPGRPKGSGRPAGELMPCGTEAAYRRHLRRGEVPHPEDTEAATRAATARKRARQGRRP